MNICGLLNVPDIPADVLVTHPYAIITKGNSGTHLLFVSDKEFIVGNGSLLGVGWERVWGSLGTVSVYSWMSGKADWVFFETVNSAHINELTETFEETLSWANHDIYEVISFNMSTMEYTIGDVYFHEYQNFNGVWLPKIPEEVLTQYPNVVILQIDFPDLTSSYGFYASENEFVFISGSMASQPDTADWIQVNPMTLNNTSKVLSNEGKWEPSYDEYSFKCSIMEGLVDILWANHNIYKAISYTDDVVVLGSELYYPFADSTRPTRYSIAGAILESIAIQIRRLTITENKIKPEDMEPMLESIQAAPELPYAEEVEFG